MLADCKTAATAAATSISTIAHDEHARMRAMIVLMEKQKDRSGMARCTQLSGEIKVFRCTAVMLSGLGQHAVPSVLKQRRRNDHYTHGQDQLTSISVGNRLDV
jgi:hypothetical protein